MTSVAVSGFRRRNGALWLAGVALAGLLAALLLMTAPAARADSPQITLSTSSTNPGGDVMITGSGWAPAKHFNLYVYSQGRCNNQPTCPPPDGQKPANQSPVPITSDGRLSFDLTITSHAATITYVITVIADYPATNPYTASVPLQIVPAGTPPSGTPISSAPSPSPSVASTNTPRATATSSANQGGNNGNQTNTPPPSSSSNKVLIVLVGLLLAALSVVLIVLLVILPPKRRAIRAAYYGSQDTGSPGYAAPGASGAPRPRRMTGGQPPVEPEMPWQGGVAQWGDTPRPPRGSRPAEPPDRNRPMPGRPRRPPGRDY